ncbi:MAG: methyltransferase domain-containing protein [Verrucomicrobiota bacterium]
MKCCFACDDTFAGESWACPRCHEEPVLRDGIVRFVEDPSGEELGFKSEFFAKLAGFEAKHFWFRARNRLLQWAVRHYFPRANCFLEIGCGTGFVLQGLHETMPRLRMAGSEIFAGGLRFARERLPGVDLYQMDARQIPFANEFDVIGAFDVLEHIVEDEAVLGQMFKATRPGGGIVVTVPQHPFLWSANDEHSLHQRRYHRAEMRRKVERAGFSVERITSFVALLLPFMIFSRLTKSRTRPFNLWEEFQISRPLNAFFELILTFERALIRAGVSFSAGGSLLLVGKKPATAS